MSAVWPPKMTRNCVSRAPYAILGMGGQCIMRLGLAGASRQQNTQPTKQQRKIERNICETTRTHIQFK